MRVCERIQVEKAGSRNLKKLQRIVNFPPDEDNQVHLQEELPETVIEGLGIQLANLQVDQR